MKTTTRKTKRDGLYLRGDTWYFRRMVGDKRVAVSTECKDRRQAERRKTELDKDMNDGKFGWKVEAKKAVPTIAEYLQIAQAVYESQREGARAIGRITALSEAFPNRTMDSLTITDCSTYLSGKMRFGLAQNSARACHIIFKAFWNRAIGDHLVSKNPWKFPAPKAVARQRVLSYAEQVQLWPVLPEHVRRLLTVIVLTGLRSGEIRNIERRDCDFDRRQITVRTEVAKMGKARVVPMPAEAAQAIREQLDAFETGNLGHHFPRWRAGEPRIFPYATNGIVHALRDAGNTSLTAHDLRRTFGTRCAESGVPMTVLKEWMGHSSITITAQFYTHIDSTQHTFVSRMEDATAKGLAAVTPATGTEG